MDAKRDHDGEDAAPADMTSTVDCGEDKNLVMDSSVDYKGRKPVRSKTGRWPASIFIIGIEFVERMSYYGIASNLIIYLNKVLGQDVTTAAKNVNNWIGVTTVVPLLGGFLADSYLGRFMMAFVSSIVYLVGLVLLTLSQLVPSLKPNCNKTLNSCTKPSKGHELAFFLALYLISLGTGGHKPSLESFGADQFDEEDEDERKKKASFFNWWYFGLCSGALLGVTVVVYVEDHIGWGAGFGILTASMAVAIFVLIAGIPFYRYRIPTGSPLTPVFKVFVAAIKKWRLPYPSDPVRIYGSLDPDPCNTTRRKLGSALRLRFLDKASIIDQVDEEQHQTFDSTLTNMSSWRLATQTQVEETKQLLSVFPIWFSTLMFGICTSQGQTFFIKQGSLMDRNLTPNFQIPSASLLAFGSFAIMFFVLIYDKILVPVARKITGHERGITLLQRIGIGMAVSILCMISAAIAENKRRNSEATLSVFWLTPQFVLLGVCDVFTLVGLQEFFYDQVPNSMRSLGIAFYLCDVGVASFLSTLLITIVDIVSKKVEGKSWFQADLNKSKLDYFFWLIAVLGVLNLCIYVWFSRRYEYKKSKKLSSSSGDSG